MSSKSALKFARTDTGYRLSVVGRGTMQESQAAETFVVTALKDAEAVVLMDLCECEYLDSTFLGCLIGLNRQFGGSRFHVAAPPERAKKLFGPTRIDMLLKICPDLPAVLGDWVTISPASMNAKEIARHIMDCHRRLAEIPGPQQNAFAAIAQQMARELNQSV